MTSSHDDICSALDRHAAERPDGLTLRFLHDGEADGAATELTFAALRARAQGVVAALQQRLVRDRALLLYEGGVDFVTAFLGCLYAGIVAVPAYPPDPQRIHRTLPRLRAIDDDARAKLVLASDDILHVAEPICAQADGLRDLIRLGSGAIEHGAAPPHPHAALASDLAFLQYTSGSTGDPLLRLLWRPLLLGQDLAGDIEVAALVREAEFDADVAAGRQVAAEAERVRDLVVGDLSGPARRHPYGGRSKLAKADHVAPLQYKMGGLWTRSSFATRRFVGKNSCDPPSLRD